MFKNEYYGDPELETVFSAMTYPDVDPISYGCDFASDKIDDANPEGLASRVCINILRGSDFASS